MKINSVANYYKCLTFKGNETNKTEQSNTLSASTYVSPEQKLNAIMPRVELLSLYDDICKDLKLDYKPKLNLIEHNKDITGGGYTFQKNTIDLSMEDLTESDYKIVGTKNGKKVVLVSPKNSMPLFASKELGQEFLDNAKKNKNFGFDNLEMVPTTSADKKRLIVQKISHELIHAQQHMILRQTEGIGAKEILKAWTHIKPANPQDYVKLNELSQKLYEQSFWADKPMDTPKVGKFTPVGFMALKWLDAIKNYPPFASPQYEINAIEVDAYRRSAQYAMMKFGPLMP